MGWQPRWRHVSQLFRHGDDGLNVVEGANDCFEACLARYLREMAYPFVGDDNALVAAMRLLATGQPDHAGQGFTSLQQAGQALDALGIPWRWSGDLAETRAARWAILWVRAARLRTAAPNLVEGRRVYTDYPLWWLGSSDDADHFILLLPSGAFNDPLSYWGGGRDATYTATSIAAAFAGAFLLLGPPRSHGPLSRDAAGTAVTPETPLVVTAADGLHLREAPTMAAPVLATLQNGEALRDVYDRDCLWSFVEARGLHGWVRREYTRR